MKTAVLKTTPGSGGLRFEVHSMPTRGNHGVQKWYMKANHPVEASRWVQALTKGIQWARREAERQSEESEVSSLLAPSTRGTSSTWTRRTSHQGPESTGSSIAGGDEIREGGGTPPRLKPPSSDEHDSYIKGQETEASSSVAESENLPPHNGSYDLHANTTVTQMELNAQLLQNLPVASTAGDLKSALIDSFNTTRNLLTEYVQMGREREEWWKDKLERERERQSVWEESLQAVVREGEIMEKELRTNSRRRSKTFTTDSGYLTVSEMGTIRNRPSTLGLEPPLEVPAQEAEAPVQVVESPEPTPTPTKRMSIPPEKPTRPPPPPPVPEAIPAPVPVPVMITPPATSSTIRQVSLARRVSSMSSPPPRPLSLLMGATSPKSKGDEDEMDTDDEDEFFDAIESNTLPNLVITDSLAGRGKIELPPAIDQSQYNGYAKLRTQLAITSDDRPPMSLWAVLKNSIGKDLTRISFPVFFNEPTSMLQRMVRHH